MKNLTQELLAKIDEQIELSQHLILLIPPDMLDWQPAKNSFRTCDLLGHLLEAFAGFCAALYAARPQELSSLLPLRDLPVNHCCGIEEASKRIEEYRGCIRSGFAVISDEDLTQQVPTVFKKSGESLLMILLGNLEHLINHKHQLFFYLKLQGVSVTSKDLYRFR